MYRIHKRSGRIWNNETPRAVCSRLSIVRTSASKLAQAARQTRQRDTQREPKRERAIRRAGSRVAFVNFARERLPVRMQGQSLYFPFLSRRRNAPRRNASIHETVQVEKVFFPANEIKPTKAPAGSIQLCKLQRLKRRDAAAPNESRCDPALAEGRISFLALLPSFSSSPRTIVLDKSAASSR